MLEIQSINLYRRLALVSDDTICPIITMLDEDGEETEMTGEARAIVVEHGPESYLVAYMDDFETIILQ